MILYIFILYFSAFALPANSWSYKNLVRWPDVCRKGRRQSPINLIEEEGSQEFFLPLSFKNYNKDYTAILEHAVNTVRLILDPIDKVVPSFTGGNYKGEYVLDQIHFHWQSEHTINNKRFPMEVHLIHHKAKYATPAAAMVDSEGIGTLAVLFDAKLFESVDDGTGPMATNYRPIQMTHKRKVFLRHSLLNAASTMFVTPIYTVPIAVYCLFN